MKCPKQSLAHNKWSVIPACVVAVIAILITVIVIIITNMSENSV